MRHREWEDVVDEEQVWFVLFDPPEARCFLEHSLLICSAVVDDDHSPFTDILDQTIATYLRDI